MIKATKLREKKTKSSIRYLAHLAATIRKGDRKSETAIRTKFALAHKNFGVVRKSCAVVVHTKLVVLVHMKFAVVDRCSCHKSYQRCSRLLQKLSAADRRSFRTMECKRARICRGCRCTKFSHYFLQFLRQVGGSV